MSTMKFLVFLYFVISMMPVYAQQDMSGKYWTQTCGYFHGYFLRLFPDSTAHFTPIYETSSHFDKGTWTLNNDTIRVDLQGKDKAEFFLVLDSLRLEKINKQPFIDANTLFRFEAYYPNGDIKYKLDYRLLSLSERTFDGLCFYYHPAKRLKQIIEYKKGVKNGIEMNYSFYGYLISSGTWKKGKKDGKWIRYDDDFNQIQETIYKNGKIKRGGYDTRPCFPSWNEETMMKLYYNNMFKNK